MIQFRLKKLKGFLYEMQYRTAMDEFNWMTLSVFSSDNDADAEYKFCNMYNEIINSSTNNKNVICSSMWFVGKKEEKE